jgi:hypothetical protein
VLGVAFGFLDDVNEWDLVMTGSAAHDIPSQMSATFAILLVFNEVGIIRVYLIIIGGQWVKILCTG